MTTESSPQGALTRHAAVNRRLLLAAGLSGVAAAAATTVGPGIPTARADTAPAATYLPVPEGARGPALGPDGYVLREIAHDLYWLGDGLYQMIFLVTSEGVLVVDAPPTLGNNILRAIRSVTRRPVTHVVYSHSHADHIGAASLYPARAQRIAHVETARLLHRAADKNRPLPTRTFRRRLHLNVGGEVVQLAHHGPNHTPDNIYIYAPRHQTLMLVDVVFPGWVPFKQLAVSQDIPGWIEAHDHVLAYPFTTFVGGHLTRVGTRADVAAQREYVQDLKTLSEQALKTFDPTPVFTRQPGDNPWAIFQDYLTTLADQIGAISTERWGERLGGADIFGQDNAFAMIESLRIDTGVLGPFGIHP